MSAYYDKQILDLVAAADRPLRQGQIAARIAPGNNRAWGKIGTALTHLYRAGLLSREKTDGRYWHYKAGDGTPPAHADLIYAQQLRERIDQFEAENARLREEMAKLKAESARLRHACQRMLDLESQCDYVDGEPAICPGIEQEGAPCHWCEMRAAVR